VSGVPTVWTPSKTTGEGPDGTNDVRLFYLDDLRDWRRGYSRVCGRDKIFGHQGLKNGIRAWSQFVI